MKIEVREPTKTYGYVNAFFDDIPTDAQMKAIVELATRHKNGEFSPNFVATAATTQIEQDDIPMICTHARIQEFSWPDKPYMKAVKCLDCGCVGKGASSPYEWGRQK